jgi:hypothetical protein
MRVPTPAWLVDAIVDRAKKNPFSHFEGYMNRYWFVAPKSRLGRFLIKCNAPWQNARVHEILRSDEDRELHDHPWDYTSVILKGGYTEITHWDNFRDAVKWAEKEGRPGGIGFDAAMRKWELRVMYTAGDVLRRKADFAHRLLVEEGKTATTLFIMGKKKNAWGFYTKEQGKVYYRDFLDAKEVAARKAAIDAAYN